MRSTRSVWMQRLPFLLWPLGIAAELFVLVSLFRGDADVTAVAVVNRSVGGLVHRLRADRLAAPARTAAPAR